MIAKNNYKLIKESENGSI